MEQIDSHRALLGAGRGGISRLNLGQYSCEG